MNNNESIFKIGKQGNLMFSHRERMLDQSSRTDTLWEKPVTAIAVMIVCMILDVVMFYQLFSSFLYDSPMVLMLSILAMLIGFDLAPIYLGIILKKRSQGLQAGMIAVITLSVAFFVAFIGNIMLRLEVKDLVLPDLSQSGTSIMELESESGSDNRLSLLYAIFTAFLPVITSLVSFGISFFTSNPIKNRFIRTKRELIWAENNITEMEALLTEYEEDPDHFERLMKEDEEKYRNMVKLLHEKTCYYCDYVRERIKEHLGDPASNNELSKRNREILLRLFDNVEKERAELELDMAS